MAYYGPLLIYSPSPHKRKSADSWCSHFARAQPNRQANRSRQFRIDFFSNIFLPQKKMHFPHFRWSELRAHHIFIRFPSSWKMWRAIHKYPFTGNFVAERDAKCCPTHSPFASVHNCRIGNLCEKNNFSIWCLRNFGHRKKFALKSCNRIGNFKIEQVRKFSKWNLTNYVVVVTFTISFINAVVVYSVDRCLHWHVCSGLKSMSSVRVSVYTWKTKCQSEKRIV